MSHFSQLLHVLCVMQVPSHCQSLDEQRWHNAERRWCGHTEHTVDVAGLLFVFDAGGMFLRLEDGREARTEAVSRQLTGAA